ncbi:MAG TPA: peptidylprolyl isomerase [Pyrinomonadaceae bacterium]|nr:peptidylprolyl isomerase [Pyrinomonadaceae bacterium]
MKATTKALIAVLVAVLASVGLIFWQATRSRAHGLTSLTPEDMSLIAESLGPQQQSRLASSPEERKKLSEDIRQMLAVAAEARAKGIADKPEVKRQLDAMKMLVIAQMYVKKQRDAKANPEEFRPKQEEIDAYLKDPKNAALADQYLEDLKTLGLVPEGQPITDEVKEQFRQQWAPMALMAEKGRAAGVENDRATQLQIQFQQAAALSRIYSNELTKKLEPTEEEIQAYYAAHPDLDPKVSRQKAEDVLKRARAGEDFDKLAKENSDEPGAKETGGDLGWFGRGRMVKQFEDAAFALKDNEISDIVESQFGFHIIQRLGTRQGKSEANPMAEGDAAKGGQPEEQIHARHILIKPSGGPSANPFAPPKSPRDTAKDAIIEEKTKKEVDEIAKRVNIKVPEDFPVKAPEVPQMPQGMGAAPHGGAGDPHGAGEPPPAPPAGDNSATPKGGSGKKK